MVKIIDLYFLLAPNPTWSFQFKGQVACVIWFFLARNNQNTYWTGQDSGLCGHKMIKFACLPWLLVVHTSLLRHLSKGAAAEQEQCKFGVCVDTLIKSEVCGDWPEALDSDRWMLWKKEFCVLRWTRKKVSTVCPDQWWLMTKILVRGY